MRACREWRGSRGPGRGGRAVGGWEGGIVKVGRVVSRGAHRGGVVLIKC